jgi:signal peptidase I
MITLPIYANVSPTWFNLEAFFTYLLIFTGIATLLHRRLINNETANGPKMQFFKKSVFFIADFFMVILMVWCIRSFLFQAYRVPTGSLEPTVMPGDFILVKQFQYGFKLPIFHKTIFPMHTPKRGDIALFYWPVNQDKILVKRIIGLPGDDIIYDNKKLIINGKVIEQQLYINDVSIEPGQAQQSVVRRMEFLPGKSHFIFIKPGYFPEEYLHTTVPAGHYFAMGDNRDGSSDSRAWGLVPQANLIGKAFVVIMHWDSQNYKVQWNRIGKNL